MTYFYRNATGRDKEVIFALYCTVMRGFISKIWGWNDDWQENDFAKHFKPEEITVVYKADELVGYSHIENNEDQLFLRMMVVHPDYQRTGIGTKLLESFISLGKEQSKSNCLELFNINIEAKIFYERYGFQVVSETSTSYIMRLNA